MESKEMLYEYLGALCEVLDTSNSLQFVGIIQDYDPETEEAKIQVHKGNATPQGIVYHTQVKLRVHASARSGGEMAMLYGRVTRCAPDFWRVEIQNTMFCLERRQSFRQPISGVALVRLADEDDTLHPCQLVDISLRGVGFHCTQSYEQGTRLILDKVQLLPGEEPHTFYCEVCRVQSGGTGASQALYGCSFYDMSQRQEDRLCQAIFTLQAQELNRRRGR